MISSASAMSMSLARRLLPSPLRMPSQASRLLASSSSSSPEETAHSKEDLERRAAKMQETLVKPRRRRRGPKPDSSSSDLSPMSVAMKFYLDRKRQHDAFMAHERREFDVGRRHLANMMRGEEAASGEDLMGQEEIDKAVEYLFPSGLRHPGARPLMKPPEEIFPRVKELEFDSEGRPFHPFFYTLRPNLTQTLHDVVETLEECLLFNDRMRSQGKEPDPEQALDETGLTGTRWISKKELEERLMEDVSEEQYDELLSALERLTYQYFSYKFRDFIFSFRVEVEALQGSGGAAWAADGEDPKALVPTVEEDTGRAWVEAIGQRKSSCAKVRVTKPGTGKFKITHIDYPNIECDITYFFGLKERQQVMYPLQFTKLLGLVDVEAVVYAGGCSSQAGAVRYATSLCVRPFVDGETAEEMAMAGLLTQDIRVRERKKPGQAGARRKFTWKKR